MKNIKIINIAIGVLLILSSCSDDFLEVEPKGQSLESNYYRNEAEAYGALVAAYDPVGWISRDYVAKEFALNVASDDFYTGGGSAQDVGVLQVWSNYTLDPATGPQEELWRRGYSGIFRSNMLMSKLDGVDMKEDLKKRFEAETKFLRAYYYFDLIRLFGSIPLITEPLQASQIASVVQAPREAVFAQIEQDLIEATAGLPETVNKDTEAGRATKGAAQALLGKVYLQQEKYQDAANILKEVNGQPGGVSQYGYRLMENFGELFLDENQFNSESIFEVSHSSASNADWGNMTSTEGNLLNVMSAPRGYQIKVENSGAPDFVSGWGFNIPTENLVEAFIENGKYDPRYKYTFTNVDSLANLGIVSYEKSYQDTGYFLKKFAGLESDRTEGNWLVNFPQNFYDIRLADTYLMEAEAIVLGAGDVSRAQSLLDAVRARVGNDPIPVNFENIMKERRLELAGEGHRWFDLVRTGMAAEALKFKGYVEGKHDKLPIPLLDLSNTNLEQDPAYK
ncbi:RagB/SusD family nutrient uptake outer membrane protein [Salinimicrobium sp. TIG7-5_MAKvit]|uniref:RagB/SusD family nutrient uptake outer membrane protein n=1 Tax=Salinimicrobium sp. TIG7-5_MAKvit TaxID=3121289 RepID=UPI003C6E197B